MLIGGRAEWIRQLVLVEGRFGGVCQSMPDCRELVSVMAGALLLLPVALHAGWV